MIKHDDGSVTLSKKEFSDLNKAYQKLYDILTRMPSTLQDYFSSTSEYLNVAKWRCWLNGEGFNRKDWV